jgi:hypothetical protein
VFCSCQESIDHLFFHCPIIVEFWTNILHSHPQIRSFNINSLFDLWNSCLMLSNFQYWDILLAACVWIIWLERNKRVFITSSHSEAVNIPFLILHLFQVWTGTSACLEIILGLDGNLGMAPHIVHTFPVAEPPSVATSGMDRTRARTRPDDTFLPHSLQVKMRICWVTKLCFVVPTGVY